MRSGIAEVIAIDRMWHTDFHFVSYEAEIITSLLITSNIIIRLLLDENFV